MEFFKFNYNGKEYELNENNCDYLIVNEESPVAGIDTPLILSLLNQVDDINFDIEYYDQPCENCHAGKAEKAKYFKFLEYHFYIFTKEGEYVISSISKEYENTSFNKLLKGKKADNSHIVSIMVCESCGNYSIEIEECDI